MRLSILPLLAFTLAANAYPGYAPSTGPPCADAAMLSNTTIQVGSAQVLMSGFSCDSESDMGSKSTSLAARTTPRDVCGDVCSIVSCLGSGDVPASSDCAIIADAISILSSSLGPTYLLTAANGYYKQLVYGTCLTYIGVSAQVDTEACWSDWASIITQLLSACPGSPIGACTALPPGLNAAAFSMEIRATDSV